MGCGKTQIRCDPKAFNTSEEAATMMGPGNPFFLDLAHKCVKECIAVDLFLAIPPKHPGVDIATMAPICGFTGGDIHYYHDFDLVAHGEKMYYSLFRTLTRQTVTDVTVKVRCSTGLTITDYYGSFLNFQGAEVSIGQLD